MLLSDVCLTSVCRAHRA